VLELYEGDLNVTEIQNRWYEKNRRENYGAIITFVGVIRDENSIDGLSFDLYEPILQSWFNAWQEKAKAKNAKIMMAHARGDVLLHESSYIACVLSPKRRVALEMIDAFVEDFKASAPIWKYDIICGQRRYAEDRSTKINGSGVLA